MGVLQKKLYFFLILIFTSCSEQANELVINTEQVQGIDTLSSIVRFDNIVDYTDSINCTDQHDKKQGTWIYEDPTVAWEVKVQYVNDTLHGMWTKYSKSFNDTGYFFNGKQQGLKRSYYDHKRENSCSQVILLSMMIDDSVAWQMHPAADFGRFMPRKGLRVYQDSVRVIAPYINGNIAYDGLFVKYEAVGIHNSFYLNGKQYQSIDYDNDLLTQLDTLTNLKIESQFRSNLKAGKINQSFYLFSKYVSEDKVKRVKPL